MVGKSANVPVSKPPLSNSIAKDMENLNLNAGNLNSNLG
jgi:hypothetical protein